MTRASHRRASGSNGRFGIGLAILAGAALAGAAVVNARLARKAERENPPTGQFVEVDGVRISVATGHLAAHPEARRRQLEQAAGALVARPNPRLLCGDLNIEWAQAAEWLRPYGLELAEALADPVDPALRAGLDHVAVTGMRVLSVRSRRFVISDHEARIVELDVSAATAG